MYLSMVKPMTAPGRNVRGYVKRQVRAVLLAEIAMTAEVGG